MTRWADIDTKTRVWIGAFVILVIVLIILFWTGWFMGWQEAKVQ